MSTGQTAGLIIAGVVVVVSGTLFYKFYNPQEPYQKPYDNRKYVEDFEKPKSIGRSNNPILTKASLAGLDDYADPDPDYPENNQLGGSKRSYKKSRKGNSKKNRRSKKRGKK